MPISEMLRIIRCTIAELRQTIEGADDTLSLIICDIKVVRLTFDEVVEKLGTVRETLR